MALAEFGLQLLVARRPDTVEVSRAVVAGRGGIQWARNLKATLFLLKGKKKVGKCPKL